MARGVRPQKIDLQVALALVASKPGSGYGELVIWFNDVFSCSERAAKDAVAILRQAGYVSADSAGGDRRRRSFSVTARGERVLSHPRGIAVLRVARQLFTSCASGQAAERRNRSWQQGEREVLLARVEDYYLSSAFPGIRTAILEAPLPAGAPKRLSEKYPTSSKASSSTPITEARCKVCRSEHRREIDVKLAQGQPQASIRREVNEKIGRPHFTANNISSHARNHVSQSDPGVREALDLRLEQEELTTSEHYRQLRLTRQAGLEALNLGLTHVTPAVTIQAVRALDEPEPANQLDSLEENRHDFDAFIAAIEQTSSPDQFRAVVRLYEAERIDMNRLTASEKRERLLHPQRLRKRRRS